MQNKEIRLASRPAGMPTLENFGIVDAEVPQPTDGEVLVRTLYISVDPYLRGRMREGRSYIVGKSLVVACRPFRTVAACKSFVAPPPHSSERLCLSNDWHFSFRA